MSEESEQVWMDGTEPFTVVDGARPALTLSITPRHDTIGIRAPGHSTTQFCTTVTARSLAETADGSARAPVDIVVALDVSGSMEGRKLELCRQTLALLLRELCASDRFGLVTFGDDAKLELPARKLTKANREAALAKVKGLRTNGRTNMSGGIGLAAQELQAVESPHEVRTIFLLTDGHANKGISDKAGIVSLTKNCLGPAEARRSIAIHCFGYGTHHDQAILGEISRATEGGSYYFVENDSDVSSAFGDALGGVLSVVAQNTVVVVKVAPEASDLGVSIINVKHEQATRQADGSQRVPIGDFYAEESRDIIIETALSRVGSSVAVPHVTAAVTYLDTINKRLASCPEKVCCIRRPEGDEVARTNPHVALQCIRVKAAEVIAENEKLAASHQLEKARDNIREYISKLQQEAEQLGETSNPFITQFLSELNTILAGLSSPTQYRDVGSKYMQTRCRQMQLQRCAEAMDEEVERRGAGVEATMNVFATRKKKSMAAKFMAP